MDISKEIRKLLIDENMTLTVLADKLNVTQPNISAKFKKNDFRISELTSIAEAIGYEVNISFVKRSTN